MRKLFPHSTLMAATLVAAIAALTPTAHASTRANTDDPAGGFGIRLLDVPVSEADNPRAMQYVIDHLMPGTTIRRRVEVWNKSESSLHVKMYPDAAHIADGSFTGDDGRTVSDLTTWTTLNEDSLDLPPGARAADTVTISVPDDAAPGERYAVIWAEVDTPGTSGVILANRVGTRIYLSVGGHNPPPSNFTVDTLTAQRDLSGRALVQAMVHNTGGRAIDLSGGLTLTEVSGALSAGPYPARLGTTLAPGQSEPVTIPVTDPVGAGPWKAKVELKSGLLDETYQAQITFPNSAGSAVPAAAQRALHGSSDHLTLALGSGLAAALLAVAALTYHRHRRSG